MKKTKTYFMALIGMLITTMTFTACLNNDNQIPQLTTEEIQAMLKQTQGVYTGYSKAAASITATDSVDNVSWTVAEDITIHNFPLSNIALFLEQNTGTQYTDLVNALKTAVPAELKLHHGYLDNKAPYIYLLIAADPLETTVNVNGKQETVKVTFMPYSDYRYTSATYDITNRAIGILLTVQSIQVNGITIGNSMQPYQILLMSKNKS